PVLRPVRIPDHRNPPRFERERGVLPDLLRAPRPPDLPDLLRVPVRRLPPPSALGPGLAPGERGPLRANVVLELPRELPHRRDGVAGVRWDRALLVARGRGAVLPVLADPGASPRSAGAPASVSRALPGRPARSHRLLVGGAPRDRQRRGPRARRRA